MNARFLTSVLIALASLARPLEAAFPNLLANGGFDDGLSGWARAARVAWSPAFGGSARIDIPSFSAYEALVQCVDVSGDALYSVSAAANLPQRDNGTGGLSVRVQWFARAGCQGNVLGGAPSLDFETSPEARQAKSRLVVSPPSAASAIVLLLARADTSETYAFVVDDVAFAHELFGEILTLPTAASAGGAFGQRFATDLWVRNTTAVGRRFSLRIACPTCGQNPAWIVLNLGPRETRFIADVVFDYLGGGIGGRAGAVEIAYDPAEGGLDVSARVATVNGDRPGNGTAIPARTAAEARTEATFIGLAGLGGDAGFRVNAGAFNPNDRATAVTFLVRDAAGNDLGSVERTWGPREWFQINDVLAAAGVPAGAAASILVNAGLPLFPFAIAIDNRSGDPAWLEPAPPPARY